MPSKLSILFLCTGNSARSILAETIANELFGDSIVASSAGSQPKGEPHRLALETLRNRGLRTDHCRSKNWDEFRDQKFDLVVTLCDSAAKESCPIFPGAPLRSHWGFPDPPASAEPEETFEQVFDGVFEALNMLTSLPDYDLPAKVRLVARRVRERFPEANAISL